MNKFKYATPTVSKDPSAHFGRAWRDPVGKPLSNRRIAQLMQEGRYGAKYIREARQCDAVHDGHRCTSRDTAFLRYAYLPHAGYYCPLCRARLRAQHEKERQEKRLHIEYI